MRCRAKCCAGRGLNRFRSPASLGRSTLPAPFGFSHFTTILTKRSGTTTTFTIVFPCTSGFTFSFANASFSNSSFGAPCAA